MNFKLNFVASDYGPATEIEFADFSVEDWCLLAEFMAFSDEANQTRFVKEMPYKVSFHFANSGPVRNAGTIPDDEAFSAFLHKYRPIILHTEPAGFANICALLSRQINHPFFNRMLKDWRAEYSGKSLRELFTMAQDDLTLTGQAFLDRYLNAYEYHRDADKREEMSGFAATFEPDARKALVTFLLMFKISAVNRVRDVVRRMQQLKDEYKTQNPNHPSSP